MKCMEKKGIKFFLLKLAAVFAVFAVFENAYADQCPDPTGFVVKLKNQTVLTLCGKSESEKNNFSQIKLYRSSLTTDSPSSAQLLYADKSKTAKYLAIELPSGLMLIEKIKVSEKWVELFKHEISCNENNCKLEKEVCLIKGKKDKNETKKQIKNTKLKKRMKKAGC